MSEIKLINGDCLVEMKNIPNNSVDSIVTDPPYELGFMGKSWDSTGIANNREMWAECLRVLKPGGHLLAFSGTRTYHRMATAIEDAGFEIRDMIEWVYGSGFPKSLNIGKVMDKYLKTGNASWNGTGDSSNGALGYSKLQHNQGYRPADYSNKHQNKEEITEDLAKKWEGWGTALKPAHEPICMARKPLAEKTVAENCLKYGTGGINIDESRVGTEDTRQKTGGAIEGSGWGTKSGAIAGSELGRFPANLIHDNSEEVRECFPETKSGNLLPGHKRGDGTGNSLMGGGGIIEGTYGGDSGNASRFFKSILYYPKASKSERNKGCEGLEAQVRVRQGLAGEHKDTVSTNSHPTVKPIALMEYLIKMITPKGGIVLDPFMGSGSTGVAAKKNGYDFIGIEIEEEYIKIAKARIENHKVQEKLTN